MSVLVLHGSPRKGRNSDTLIFQFIKGYDPDNKKDLRHFHPNNLNIKPCQGCLFCATSEDHNCRINDDMVPIYNAYRESDIIVFASPMYWGYLTAQIKTVLDRMEALAWKGFANKTFVVLLTYRFHCESTVAFFQRIAPFFHIDLHIITCLTFDQEKQIDLDIQQIPNKLKEAYELGVKLNRDLS